MMSFQEMKISALGTTFLNNEKARKDTKKMLRGILKYTS